MTKSVSRTRSLILTGIVFFAGIIVLSSCTKKHDSTPAAPVASVMAFNLASDKPAVGFSLSGKELTSAPMAYASFTGSYIGTAPGDKMVEAFDYNTSNGIFASTTASLKADNFYSVFLVGKGAHYQNIVVNDNIDSLSASSGLAYVRYLHAIPDSVAALNVMVSNTAGTIFTDSSPFPTLSAFKGVTPGNITVNITNANGISVTKTITVEQKKVYTVLLVGIQNSSATPLQINAITNGTLN
jgi:hypothetical protein